MGKITLEGVLAACHTDRRNITGATMLIFPEGATASALVMGGGPGTRGFDALHPARTPTPVFGIMVAGGSAMGLDAAAGLTAYLREEGIGLAIDHLRVPTVASCVIFDLFVGEPVPPRSEEVYAACKGASRELPSGSHGAGCGAVVGKLFTVKHGTKGGQAYAEDEVDGVKVGVLCVVNAFGDVVSSGRVVAGARDPGGKGWAITSDRILKGTTREIPGITSTTICIVLTDAALTKPQCYRVAHVAASGMARVIDPVWTIYDGDVVVVASVGKKKADITRIGVLASRLIERACVEAVVEAEELGGIPNCKSINPEL